MAVTRETIRLTKQLQLSTDALVGSWANDLTKAWVVGWQHVSKEWAAAVEEIVAEAAAGRAIRRSTLRKLRNAAAAIEASREVLDELAGLTNVTLVGDLPTIVNLTTAADVSIIESQLPPGEIRDRVTRRARPNRSLVRIIRRTGQQITSQLKPLSGTATKAMNDQLILGTLRQQNPRRVAAKILSDVQGEFEGGLSRALNVARTEMLDAQRHASQVTQSEFDDVLDGWQWLAKLGDRTCPACWRMHGTKHPLSEFGPSGHQQCRCSRGPLVKSWAELGIKTPEPPSFVRDGQTEFNKLPRAKQLEVMGPTRLGALESGRATWDELAVVRPNPGWRDGYYARPVRDFKARTNIAG